MKFPVQITTKSGKSVLIRPPRPSDDGSMLSFINTLSKEHTFITFQGEQLTLKEEQSFIKKRIKQIKNHEAVQLLAIQDGKVIANTSIELGIRTAHHIGDFAISISDGYRDEGLGSSIMELLLKYAKDNLPDLKIINLKVFANNEKAIHIYEKFGFKEYGRLPNGILYHGKYIDEIFMYKAL